ncbi:MAG: VOC family protein [Euryarchaeota archaeon]|nr:VOC family protein [Euryarchaeota archaeon]MBU4547727.1 VOC family protein [Euryarchaeota archaeon]MBU4607631.1 VOC family protein [Euryarchaeota archaeon]MBV1754206.1 VOC family protein [Methanobacterium sp.]
MPRVIHFEIPADDPERAIEFYKNAFGWEIEKWDGPFDYWLVKTGEEDEPGIDGAIFTRETDEIIKNMIEVESFPEFAEKIEKSGGKILSDKIYIPGIGTVASFQDTEGNISAIIEPDIME